MGLGRAVAVALIVAGTMGLGGNGHVAAARESRSIAPLPLDLVADTKALDGRSLISPDGRWVALGYERAGEVADATQSKVFTDSGAPIASMSRAGIRLVNTRSKRIVELATGDVRAWGASWSPGGTRLAYYSDEGGEAGLWIWNSLSGNASRIGSVIARPAWNDQVRWSPDGSRLLTKLLPEGRTISEINLLTAKGYDPIFPPAARGTVAARVLRVGGEAQGTPETTSLYSQENLARVLNFADLGIVDIEAGKVTRIVRNAFLRDYRFSPDGRHIAYTEHLGWFTDTQVPAASLSVYTLADNRSRRLIDEAGLGWGKFSWAPDSNQISFLVTYPTSDSARPRRQVKVLSLEGAITGSDTEIGMSDDREGVPYWAGDQTVYVQGGGSLWRLDAASGNLAKVGAPPAIEVMALVPESEPGHIRVDARSFYLLGRDRRTAEHVLLELDPSKAALPRLLRRFQGELIPDRALSASRVGLISYYSSVPGRLHEPFLLDARQRRVHALPQFNSELYDYPHGEVRIVEFTGAGGERLKGALMLPPDYRRGQRLPTVLWVYGGTTNEEIENAANSYSLRWGVNPAFNFNVLTSRGYAVFMPAIPLQIGERLSGIRAAVLPSLDALVEQGFSDPDRFAVMGQSYGSYTALSLITGTDRFKAAIITAVALGSDLFSAYALMNPDGSGGATGYFERGQGGMGGTPWEQQERYFRNSPFFSLDKVKTPLLIGQGYDDGAPFNVDGLFVALRRLERPVDYRLYQGEQHVIMGRTHVIDFWKARLTLLEKHLGSAGLRQ